jgi:hypothetical protein
MILVNAISMQLNVTLEAIEVENDAFVNVVLIHEKRQRCGDLAVI